MIVVKKKMYESVILLNRLLDGALYHYCPEPGIRVQEGDFRGQWPPQERFAKYNKDFHI
jgi:hypothetical protein